MNNKCEKCGYESEDNKFIDKGIALCAICKKFLPDTESELREYLEEKIDWKLLETFRKHNNKNIKGMQNKAEEGKIINRAPFGYKIIDKQLVPDRENRLKVEEIFRTFLETNRSLNSLSKEFGFSVNGIKKILRNFTYIGKVKFSGQILEGKHKQIITPELFNKVQNKLEKLKIN